MQDTTIHTRKDSRRFYPGRRWQHTAAVVALLILGRGAPAQEEVTFTEVKGGATRVRAPAGGQLIRFWGVNCTPKAIHDFAFRLHSSEGDVNLYRIKVHPWIRELEDGTLLPDGQFDWDLDDDHASGPVEQTEVPVGAPPAQQQAEYDNVDDSPGKTTRVEANGEGNHCCGAIKDAGKRTTKGADGQPMEDPGEGTPPGMTPAPRDGYIHPAPQGGAKHRFLIEITLTRPLQEAADLEITPSDAQGKPIAFLEPLRPGENYCAAPAYYPRAAISVAAPNATGRTIAGLVVESQGALLLRGTQEILSSDLPGNTARSSAGGSSLSELVFSQPVPPGGIVAFTADFNGADPEGMENRIVITPILDSFGNALANLRLSSTSSILPGGNHRVELLVHNAGPAATADVGLRCALTGSHELVAATSRRGNPFISARQGSSLVLCELATLRAGEEAIVELELVAAGAGADLRLEAEATGAEVDPDHADNRLDMAVLPADQAAAPYRWNQLGVGALGGYYFDLAACGQTAGWSNDGEVTGAAILSQGGIETVAAPGGFGIALGINRQGWLCGMVSGEGGTRGFLRPAGGRFIDLPSLGGRLSSAAKLNESSTLVAGMATATDDPLSPWLATIWYIVNEGGERFAEPQALPGLGIPGGAAQDVNTSGLAAGYSIGPDGKAHAVVWQPRGGAYVIEDLGPGAAAAVSETGVVAGELTDVEGIARAFFKVGDRLATLPGPDGCEECPSHAAAVNAHGQIAGWVESFGAAPFPVVWDIRAPEARPVRLDTVIAPGQRGRVALKTAAAINDAGQVLVAGSVDGAPQTFLLTPEGGFNPDLNRNLVPDNCEAGVEAFSRGDVNADGDVNLSDSIRSLAFLFTGSAPLACLDAADANDDGALDISDPVHLLLYLFNGGPEVPAPFKACGIDTTADVLACADSGPCAPGAQIEVVKEPCEGGRLLLKQATWECRGGFWAFVQYDWYECPPDRRIIQVEVAVDQTKDPCRN